VNRPVSPMDPTQSSATVVAVPRSDLNPSKSTSGITLSVVLAVFVAIEFLAVAVSAYLASVIYFRVVFGSWFAPVAYVFASFYIATLNSSFSLMFRHHLAILRKARHVFMWNGLGSVGLSFSIFVSTIFFLKVAEYYSRGSFIFQIIAVSITVLTARAALYSWLRSLVAAGSLEARRVVLLGNILDCSKLAGRLKVKGIQTVSTFRFPVWRNAKSATNDKNTTSIKSDVDKLVEACRSLRPDDIIALTSGEDLPSITGVASSLSEIPVGFHIIPVGAPELLETSRIVEIGDLQVIELCRPPLSLFDRIVKRTFDICAAIVGLIILFPLLLVISIAIKLESPGPICFRQTRHGFNNEPIRLIKFRSMTTTEDGDKFIQAMKNDTRVTRVGRIMRYTSIDELSQLVNVLFGEMSIVGPRPHPTALNDVFKEKISPYSRRHTVKPGITGWAQVNGFRGPTDTLEKMSRRIEHDIYYVDNWSFLFDMKIIMMTLFAKSSYQNAY
jgi:Undecaprenyl-phosphate glucose phosphotransferase